MHDFDRLIFLARCLFKPLQNLVYLSRKLQKKTKFLWVRINYNRQSFVSVQKWEQPNEIQRKKTIPKFVVCAFFCLFYLMTDWIISCNFFSLRFTSLILNLIRLSNNRHLHRSLVFSCGLGVCVCSSDGHSPIRFISSIHECVRACFWNCAFMAAAAACDWVWTCRLLILCIFLF